MNKIYNFNKTIEKCDSDGIKVTCDFDFTGWEFVYMAKHNSSDKDQDAVIVLTPITITENNLNKIFIEFSPNDTSNVVCGIYFHALKAISANEQTARTLFKGKLTVEQNYINAPEE